MTNGIGKHGRGEKKGEAKPKRTTRTATAAALKKGVKTRKKSGGK
jgi:hypothetical protein